MMSVESNYEKSVSCQKKDRHCHARPSFFWYDNDKDTKVCFLVTRVRCVIGKAFFWYDNDKDLKVCFLVTRIRCVIGKALP